MVNPRRKNSLDIYRNDAYFNDANYYYDYEANKNAYQKGFRTKLDVLSRYCAEKRKLLDVGAAYGFFMEEAARYGFEPYGIELSHAAARYASRYGSVFEKPLQSIETEHRFSAITFIDSLEHFEDPVAGLLKASELLEVGGIIAVMVPNIDSLFARVVGSRWHLLLPEEHLFYFTPKSMRLVLQKTGFDLVHLGTGGYGRSLAEIARVIFRGRELPLRAAETLLRKITFEVNLGDIFAVARKQAISPLTPRPKASGTTVVL
jgi:2-polyprenyl-3-methyl-5-hydroxy-6-metoxy-1,4-benzoquinol methylase